MKAKSVLAAVLALSALAGCGGAPGGGDEDKAAATPSATAEAKPDISKAGNVTLRVWDQNVRGGQNAEIEELNKQFQAKYPNVTIERTKKSFEDLLKTVKLAASGDDAPDVIQVNQGRGTMGEIVKAGLLRPVDDYAKVYDWESRYSSTLLDLNRFSSDGAEFGSGELYGLSQMGEIVGVFYNKDKVTTPPTTLTEFEASLQQAKDAGDTPIMFGNLEKWPGIHNFESVLGQTADKQAIRDFVFAREGASFDNPEFQAGATKIKEWVDKGYFNKDFNGTDYDPAWQSFAKGDSWYLIAGTWVTADLAEQMGDKVGFMLMPGQDPNAPVSLGGEDLPFTISSASKVPDVAAAYIDFLTDANAAKVLVDTNNLPAMKGAPTPSTGVSVEVAQAWQKLNDADGVIPYLDYTTPTFYDDISSAIQELLAGKQSPTEFTAGVQEAYDKWAESR
ncbi:extracellular solute-binding protein [Solirubrobacter sp. CPCC 204708]|uniref:Extracellular solute-binding protein n=1 Tax=Solirubrobacter deserti TaxID=2282478 RepID=A0ABT4RGZ6_9ACTN|nr:extracellular solute-binding protein [Solirubrobacter deserti]MBE2319671.1 extracellular solute-binding protein [Solirubrobacter deserti]MDA0137590.1 extracellular solute-binding protein [Solirubrobacter deserti]